MADEEAQVLAAARKLPLDERTAHKNWKVRSEAFDDIKNACSRALTCEEPIFDQACPVFSKAVGDSNANVMDKALDALCAYLQKSDEAHAARIAGAVCSSICSKCLKSRPATLNKAIEGCLLFVELEQQAAVMEAAIQSFGDKVPKAAVAALDIALQSVLQFGTGVIEPKPLMKALPAMFSHSNVQVRDKAKEITVALASFISVNVIQGTLLSTMNDAMKKDVESAIHGAGKRQPERWTRKEAAQRAAMSHNGPIDMDIDAVAVGDGEEGKEPGVDTTGMDPYDFSDPVDIMAPIVKEMVVIGDDSVPFWDCFESKKWNIRRAALDKVRDAAKRNPKLSPSNDYTSLVQEMKKILNKDANINCAAGAAEAAGALAAGLRADFSSYARIVCPALLDRFKEKNIVMSKAADEALRTLAQYCFGIVDVAEEIAIALNHKNPKVRLDTLRLLKDMLESTEKGSIVRVKDILLPAVAKLSGEADAGIREAAQAVLVTFSIKAGSLSVLDKVLGKIDDSRRRKIEEQVQAAVKTKSSASQSQPTPARSAAPSAPAAKKASPRTLAPKTSSRNASTTSLKAAGNGTMASKSISSHRSSSKPCAPASADDDDMSLASGRLSAEEAESILNSLIGASSVELLKSVKWQDRLEATTSVVTAAASKGPDADPLLVQAVALLPGWSDKNFQVINKAFELVELLASTCTVFSKKDAVFALDGLSERIHESKHKAAVYACLTCISEAVGPQFVISQLHRRAAAHKNPKVLVEALGWIAETVTDFGLAAVNVRTIIDWMKTDLTSTNPLVKEKAMGVLGSCHAQLGPECVALLNGLKPAQMTALEEVFRVNPYSPTAPTKRVRKAGPPQPSPTAPGNRTAQAADEDGAEPMSMDDILPRVDVSSKLTPSLIASIGDSNWKSRNAALDELENILNGAGNRIAGNVGNELFPALRGRLADTNRNLAAKTLLLVGKFASAMGPSFDKAASRPMLVPALGALSDNKKQVRDAVLVMLDAWLDASSPDRLFSAVADAVANPKCLIDGKLGGLQWMTRGVRENPRGLDTCADAAIRAAAAASLDKSSVVKEAGSGLLTELISTLGQECVVESAATLETSTKKTAMELMTKLVGSAAIVAPSASTARGSARPSAAPISSRTPGASSANPRTPVAPVEKASAGPILLMGSGKHERARKYRPRPGRFEGPASDENEALYAALSPVTSDAFRSLLFSTDFKQHMEAADMLMSCLPQLFAETQASLDLLLRWFVLRICDGNSQSLIKVLETTRSVLQALADSGYQMTEYEALILLPCIVEKAGHPLDRVRLLHRDVLRICSALHPSHKIIDHIACGLTSKNSRTKIESCEQISDIVEKEGMGVVVATKSKPLQQVALLLKERDGSTRAAALSCIESVWSKEGEGVWRHLGRLEPREHDLIEEKLRRSVHQPPPMADRPAYPTRSMKPSIVPSGNGLEVIQDNELPVQQSVHLVAARNQVFTPRAAVDSPIFAPTPCAPGLPVATSSPGRQPTVSVSYDADPDFPARWEEHVRGVESPSLPLAVEAMKQLCADIMLATEGKASPRARALIGGSSERLFDAILLQLRKIFASATVEISAGRTPSSRGCKYALNVMLQAMAVPEAAQSLPQAPLREAICLLLVKLLDERSLIAFEEGSTLVKAVNVLMLKMLEASNRTYAFGALLQLLRQPPQEVAGETTTKFYDLVVKCLIKLTKSLQVSLDGVDIPGLLLSLHDFFLYLGLDEIRKRSSADDKPLRMAKTILHELCKMRGYDIYEDASSIPGRDSAPQPLIFAYIGLNLQSLSESGYPGLSNPPPTHSMSSGAASIGPITSSRGGDEENSGDAVAHVVHAAMNETQKTEVKTKLKDIMTRLVQKEKSGAAMGELYVLKKAHPQYVDKYIAGTSDMFRAFIMQGLAALEAEGGMARSGKEYSPAHETTPEKVGSSRLSALRERMSMVKQGNIESNSGVKKSIEELSARMASLRRPGG